MQIADRWFERKEMGDGVTWLWEPHVHPFLRCNIWFIKGRDRHVILDSGLGVASLRDEIADLADKPVIAVASHVHYDHVGSLHEFEHRCMHTCEAPLMNPYHEFTTLRVAAFGEETIRAVEASGHRFDSPDLIDAIPHPGFELDAYRVTATTPTRLLNEGDEIDLGDRCLHVMHLPGHSPGSIGLWEPASATLFSGDAVYDGLLFDGLTGSNIGDYLATMERLRQLDAQVVHGGHEPSFSGARLKELCASYIAAKAR